MYLCLHMTYSLPSIIMCESESRSVVSNSLLLHGLSMEFSRPEYWSGQPFPSPGDLPNPGTEPRSLAFQEDSLPGEPKGGPGILEWVAYPFSSRSSQPRNQTGVSCSAGRFFTNWAIREALRVKQKAKDSDWWKTVALSTQYKWQKILFLNAVLKFSSVTKILRILLANTSVYHSYIDSQMILPFKRNTAKL